MKEHHTRCCLYRCANPSILKLISIFGVFLSSQQHCGFVVKKISPTLRNIPKLSFYFGNFVFLCHSRFHGKAGVC